MVNFSPITSERGGQVLDYQKQTLAQSGPLSLPWRRRHEALGRLGIVIHNLQAVAQTLVDRKKRLILDAVFT